MSKTNNVNVDPVLIKNKLILFENIQDDLNVIAKLVDVQEKTLIPREFYDGLVFYNVEFNEFSNHFIDTIKSIKKYMDNLEYVNSNSEINNENIDLSLTSLSKVGINFNDNDINNTNLGNNSVGFSNSNYSSNLINSIDDNSDTIIDIVNNTNNENINILDDNYNNVSDSTHTNNSENTYVLDNENNDTLALNTINGNQIIDRILDDKGNIIAVSIISSGQKIWYQVINGKIIVPNISNDKIYELNNDLEIIVNGERITITRGKYRINNIICNEDGSLKSLRIIYNDYKLWLHFDNLGNIISVNYITNQHGVFAINNPNYDIYNIFGNISLKFNSGNYYIYDVLYDAKGNVLAFRLSPDGEYEKWLYLNGNTIDGNYSFFNSSQSNEKANISLFDNNKGLYGLLGILFVSLGATLIVRKKLKKKIDQEEEANDNEVNNNLFIDNAINENLQEELPTGNYAVYDVHRDDDGLVTEARINPIDDDDEYWIEM